MKTVLLVEDDRFLGDLYSATLEQAGFGVHRAVDAQSAVDILDEYGTDLILLDLMLPAHNGVEVLQEIQSYSDWQQIPVIILSSQHPAQGYDQKVWSKFGVRDYLYKPEILPAEIVASVEQWL